MGVRSINNGNWWNGKSSNFRLNEDAKEYAKSIKVSFSSSSSLSPSPSSLSSIIYQ